MRAIRIGVQILGGRERAEDEIGAGLCIAEQIRNAARHPLNDLAPPGGAEHEQRKARLEQEGWNDDPQADPPPVR
jgi:hypothetical protein